MTDYKRIVLWVIFVFSLLVLWDNWQVHNGRSTTFFPQASAPAGAQSAAPDSAEQPASAPAADDSVPTATQAAADGTVPVAASEARPAATASAATPPAEQVTLASDVLRLVFDSTGGVISHAEMLRYMDLDDKSKPFVLFNHTQQRTYLAQTGLTAGKFPSHLTEMRILPGERELGEGRDEVSVSFESPEVGGLQLIKTYTLRRGEYAIGVTHEIINVSDAPLTPKLYLQLLRDGSEPPGNSYFYRTFTGAAIYTDEIKYKKAAFKDIESGKFKISQDKASDGYAAMVQHYFVSAWLLPQGEQRQLFVHKTGGEASRLYASGMFVPMDEIAPGGRHVIEATLYAGPQLEKVLHDLSPGLDLVKDYGWLTILSRPLYWLLNQIHNVLQNWGWSIVVLVILLKIVLYWPNAKAYESMGRMRAINPRVMEIRERYKDNPQLQQQEMMRIYREEKVNPVGGCLPVVLQIPIFIALFYVLQASVELRGAPWIWWIQDLSSKDPYYILPVLMTASSLFQVWLNPKPADPTQAKIMWFMPLMFSVFFFMFPAGLVLYWLTNNLLSILQQWFINKRLGV